MMKLIKSMLVTLGFLILCYPAFSQEWPKFLLEDFQINENVGSCPQDQTAIAKLANGGFVLVWRDYRNGGADIYAQKFNKDGSRNGGNIKVDRAAAGINCSNPDVVGDHKGGYSVVWEEPGADAYKIMCRRFDQFGSPTSNPFALKVDSQSPGEKLPAITDDKKGGFIVAWQDKRNDNGDIYCQRYDSTSAPIRDNFYVNDDNVGEGTQSFPAIASDSDGGFLIVWQDNRAGFENRIFGQRYDASGRTINFNFCVDEDLSGPQQWSPDVSFSPTGEYVIVWKNGTQEDLDIWARHYAADNTPAADYIYVTNDSSDTRQFNPAVAHDENGDFVFVWRDDRNEQNDIYFQSYTADGGVSSDPTRVNDNLHSAHHYLPHAISIKAGQFLIGWDDYRGGLGNIYAQRFNLDATRAGINFRINDDIGSSYQESPAVVRNRKGEIFVAWTDYRHGGQDIYAQKIDTLRDMAGENFRISERHGSLSQNVVPSLAAGPHSISCAWNQNGFDSWDVLTQSWNFSGEFAGANDTLPGFSLSAHQINPHLAYYADGAFVAVWAENKGDNTSGEWDIFAQRFAADRQPVNNPILVNFDNRDGRQDFPFVATHRDGGFVVTYIDFISGQGGLMAQRYDADGNAKGTNFRVDTGGYVADRVQAPAVFDSFGGFIITWSGLGKSSQGIFFKQYSDDGVPFRGVTTVDSIFTNAPLELKEPAVAIDDDNNFAVAWQRSDKSRASSSIVAAYYNSNGELSFPIFNVHKPTASFASEPSIALYDGWLFTSWSDNRVPGQGFDIWSSLLELRTPTSVAQNGTMPSEFVLFQNYPNPFNADSKIKYSLPISGFVEAIIYDMRGREILSLFNGRQESGLHTLSWDGRNQAGYDVASGIYFCRVKCEGQIKTIKMALMR